jgi:hypothetical protein
VLRGDAQDPLSVPTWLTIGRDGTLWFTERGGTLVQYSSDGRRIQRFGSVGHGPGEFTFPVSSGFIGDSLWIVDAGTRRISILQRAQDGLQLVGMIPFGPGLPAGGASSSRGSVVFGYVDFQQGTSLATAEPGGNTLRWLGSLPELLATGSRFARTHPLTYVARVGERLAQVYGVLDSLFLVDDEGRVTATFPIPSRYRRPSPRNPERQWALAETEPARWVLGGGPVHVAAVNDTSVLVLNRQVDITTLRTSRASPRDIYLSFWLSVLTVSGAATCVDVAVSIPEQDVIVIGSRADTLYVYLPPWTDDGNDGAIVRYRIPMSC